MSKFIDLTGEKFGLLTVIEKSETLPMGIVVWKCKCDCGNITFVRGKNLKTGAVKSCGCLLHESHNKTHGLSKTKEYQVWYNIKRRCYSQKDEAYKYYGARGIKMCDEWLNSFEEFYKWIKANKTSESQSIDRIDNDGDYSPENCRMADAKTQTNNRRRCRYFTFNGKTQTLMMWCEELGLDYKRTHNRLYKLGWDFERAITTPVDINKRNAYTQEKKAGEKNSRIYK